MVCPFCQADIDDTAEGCFQCGRSLYTLTRGSILDDRYEILTFLGRGGMGLVYKAHDRTLDEVIALKVLRGEIASSEEAWRRFRSEIKLARQVRHRNVCGIHEYGQHGHLHFITMEFMDGVNLKAILRNNRGLPSGEAFDSAIQIAAGLAAIHEVGIVHRDLKTPNIMRDRRGVVRLMDFGIAKLQEGEAATNLTGTGLVVGTPEYMSPEQAQGHKVDARADLYSLGVVIFEIFTGDVPFKGDTPLATILKHIRQPPLLDRGPVAGRLPPALVPVLRRALAKDRHERYASAQEMVQALVAVRDQTVRIALGSIPSVANWAPTPEPVPASSVDQSEDEAVEPLPDTARQRETAVFTPTPRPIPVVELPLAVGSPVPPQPVQSQPIPPQPGARADWHVELVLAPEEEADAEMAEAAYERAPEPSAARQTAIFTPTPQPMRVVDEAATPSPDLDPTAAAPVTPLPRTYRRPSPRARPDRRILSTPRSSMPKVLPVLAVLFATPLFGVALWQLAGSGQSPEKAAALQSPLPTTAPATVDDPKAVPAKVAPVSKPTPPPQPAPPPTTAPVAKASAPSPPPATTAPKPIPTPARRVEAPPPAPRPAATPSKPSPPPPRRVETPSPPPPTTMPRPSPTPSPWPTPSPRPTPSPMTARAMALPSPPPTERESTTTPIAASVPPVRSASPVEPLESPVHQTGILKVSITPWAHVVVDGTNLGQTPISPFPLPPGVHTIRLLNDYYLPLQRKITIRPGETTFLRVDLAEEAFPKKEN